MNERRVDDLTRFAELQIKSLDIDPAYPLLKWMERDMEPEQALWRSIVYVAYHSLPSSEAVFQVVEPGGIVQGAAARLPTDVERRGLRGGMPMTLHFESWAKVIELHGSLTAFFKEAIVDGDPKESWRRMVKLVQTIRGNGRWAGYKLAEVLMKSNGWPLEPPDMGNENSTGPRQGLALFFDVVHGNSPAAIRQLDEQGWILQDLLARRGLPIAIEELETCLCDFHAMADGRYYNGKGIDDILAQLTVAEADWRVRPHIKAVWEAREAVLPRAYLGEFNGWKGVDRHRGTHYVRTGEVISR